MLRGNRDRGQRRRRLISWVHSVPFTLSVDATWKQQARFISILSLMTSKRLDRKKNKQSNLFESYANKQYSLFGLNPGQHVAYFFSAHKISLAWNRMHSTVFCSSSDLEAAEATSNWMYRARRPLAVYYFFFFLFLRMRELTVTFQSEDEQGCVQHEPCFTEGHSEAMWRLN